MNFKMNFKNLILLCSTVAFALSSVAQASGSSGTRGGGNAVQTSPGQWSLLDLAETLPYDYFKPLATLDQAEYAFSQATLSLTFSCNYLVPGTLGHLGPSMALHLGQAIDFLNERNSVESWEIKPFEKIIGQQLVWIGTETPLENIKDQGVIRYVDPSTLIQVAAQKDGVVMVYMPIFRQFDGKNRAALVVHESILRIILKTNPKAYAKYGTEKIRELVNLVFNKDFDSLPQPVREGVCGPQADLFR